MSSSSDLLPRAPSVPGFFLHRKLGEGGMGAVWLAERTNGKPGQPRRVALKLLLEQPSAESLLRFQREQEALAGLVHPSILRLLDADLDAPTPWLALELVEGRSLYQRLAEDGPLSPSELQPIALRVARALAHAHSLGLIHRDIKPANILLRSDSEEPVLADFGLAFTAGQSALTLTGEAIGTLAYMPPEVLEGRSDRGGALDQWSLGVTLYEALTGVRPFPATSPLRLLQSIRAGAAPPARLNPRIPPALDAIVMRCLEPNPKQRFPDMSRLADALEDLPVSPGSRARITRPSGRATAAAMALLLAFVAGLTLLDLQQRRQRRADFEDALVTAGRRLQSEEDALGEHIAKLIEARALERIAALVRLPDPEPRPETELERRLIHGRATPELNGVVDRAARGRAARLLERLREAERRWSKLTTGETAPDGFPGLAQLDRALEALGTGRPITELPKISDGLLRASVAVIEAAAALRESSSTETPATLGADSTSPGGLRREAIERAFVERLTTENEPLPTRDWTTLFATATEPASAVQSRMQRRLERRFKALLEADDRRALGRLVHTTHGALLTEAWLKPPPVPVEDLRELSRLELAANRSASAMLLYARALVHLPKSKLQGVARSPDYYAARSAHGHLGDRAENALESIFLAIRAARLGLVFRTLRQHNEIQLCDRRALAELVEARPKDRLLRYWLLMVDIYQTDELPAGPQRQRREARLREQVEPLLSVDLPPTWRASLILARSHVSTRTTQLSESPEAQRDQIALFEQARSRSLAPDLILIELLRTLSRLRQLVKDGDESMVAKLDQRLQSCAEEARRACEDRFRRSADGELEDPDQPGVWLAFLSSASRRTTHESICIVMANLALRRGDLKTARAEVARGFRFAPGSERMTRLAAAITRYEQRQVEPAKQNR